MADYLVSGQQRKEHANIGALVGVLLACDGMLNSALKAAPNLDEPMTRMQYESLVGEAAMAVVKAAEVLGERAARIEDAMLVV